LLVAKSHPVVAIVHGGKAECRGDLNEPFEDPVARPQTATDSVQ